MPRSIETLKERRAALERSLADPAVIADSAQCTSFARELAEITPLLKKNDELEDVRRQIGELRHILSDTSHDRDFLKLAEHELNVLEAKERILSGELQALMTEPDPDLNRNCMIEIRAGTGGQEASLFAADLYRMYTKYGAAKNWIIELMSINATDLGGLKEVIFSVRGKEAYRRLKYESGVHRVQRVPTTEASGRIHTSTATVAVLFEPEEADLNIDPKDLKIDVYRSSGHGGQSVNTTDSAVRITHLPTGLVVTCQDERSQLKNKIKAMRVLRTRLLDEMVSKKQIEQSEIRRSQIGTGDRSEKIRTYNFPDRRVTDHRIGFTSHRLEEILNGSLDELTDALVEAERKTQ